MSVHDDDIRETLGRVRQAEIDALEPEDFEALRARVEARLATEEPPDDIIFASFDGSPESSSPQTSMFDGLSTEPGQDTPSAATQESSGLLDIQHLTSIHTRPEVQVEKDIHLTPVLTTPLVPESRSSWMVPMMLVLGMMALMMVGGLGYVWVLRADAPQQPQKVIVEKTIIKEVAPAAPAGASEADKAVEKAKEAAAKAAIEEEKPEDTEEAAAKKPKSKRSSSSRKSSSSKPKKSTPAASSSSSSKKKKDGIDSILSNLDNKNKKPAASKKPVPKVAPPPSTRSSAKLSKAQVRSTFAKYKGRFSTCFRSSNKSGLKGTVWISFKIEASGRVSSSSVAPKSSKFKATDLGRCMVKVARSMKFPGTSMGTSFTYPLAVP